MTSVERVMDTTPDRVWEILADGWLYPLWVVGATRMREVEKSWPAVGAQLHHSFGVWPLVIDDSTEVRACTPEHHLGLRARGWPAGEADVEIHLTPEGAKTRVRIDEDAVSGPGVLVPPPIRAVTLKFRNVETLRRLAFLAERRA